jgi:hypothetical protein
VPLSLHSGPLWCRRKLLPENLLPISSEESPIGRETSAVTLVANLNVVVLIFAITMDVQIRGISVSVPLDSEWSRVTVIDGRFD